MQIWRFVEDHPALVIEGGERSLVVSDLHIGLEDEMRRNGIYIPSQTDTMLQELESMSASTGSTNLVLLGDVKNSVSGMSPYEIQEVRRFMERATSMFREVVVVPGNHDGGLAMPGLRSVKVVDPRGMVLDVGGLRVGLAHGHTRIPDYMKGIDALIVGHNHLYLGVGPAERYQIWVRCVGCGGIGELVMMPAFNRLLGGASIGERRVKASPIFKLMMDNDERAEVYLLNGYYLGTLSSLKASVLVEED